MRTFASVSFRLLGGLLDGDHGSRRDTARALRAARIRTFPEWYVAQSIVAAALAGVVTFGVLCVLLYFVPFGLTLALRLSLALGVGALAAFGTRLVFLLYPRVRSSMRASAIDKEYQSAVVLCYALARGGMSTMEIFRIVASERRTYGEISTEFDAVVRDIELFGLDIVKALQNAAATTPSPLMKGFLEGLVSILNSGADPRDYFKRQAEVQLARAEADTEKELSSAGMLAEVYVSSFLVLPLLVLVVLSGLSSLGNGQERYIPYVVYGLIPAGTLFYLIFLEVMMPAVDVHPRAGNHEKLADFGIATLPRAEFALDAPSKRSSDADAEALARGLPLRERVTATLRRRKDALLDAPADALHYSGPAALVVLLAGGALLAASHPTKFDLLYRGVELALLVGVVAALPVALFHELRLRRARRVEHALPETLSKLAGFNERGIGLLQSFQILGRSSTGPLAGEMRKLDRDVQVNGTLQGAIRRLRDRVNTLRMTKLTVLLERASMSTGNMKEVLDIAAAEETRAESLRSRKRQTMMSYVLVVYLVFGVFLYVAYMTTTLFYGNASFAIASGSITNPGTRVGGHGLAPADARLLFFHAVILQAVGCGLVAGRLGEGHTLSGVKHSVVLATVSLVTFALGVM